MKRVEFLKSLGFSGSALWVLLTACQRDTEVIPGPVTNGPVDFTLDLGDPANAVLRKGGGYVISNGVVVARTPHGGFVAATQTCSHEKNQAVVFQGNEFVCTVHGAKFDTAGRGMNNLGSRGLRVFKTELKNLALRVYS
ncbi:hypothetical protein GCM10023189_05650 [Nibrella saemangeumensis]|uniref:Rieske domain-containing protein n=1 Tax=Nibrella saemangeumensis TaxID=1084526 RepID=A0ABP8MBZ7_9BACT